MTDSNASDDVRRVMVKLIPKATEALDRLTEATGLNPTDVINRAVQFYDMAETATQPQGSFMAIVDRYGNADRVSWS